MGVGWLPMPLTPTSPMTHYPEPTTHAIPAVARAPRLACAQDMESTRAPRADLFDPAALSALGHFEIVARWIVDGFLSGLHRSPRKGFSVEFADFRPYQPGDDLRYVDWKIAARADRWVVRQYEEETNLRATLVLDVSRSMADRKSVV